jgi:hypothetical protein
MTTDIMIMILVSAIFIAMWFFNNCSSFDNTNNIEGYTGRYGAPCFVCSDQSYATCLNCTNCGYCLNDDGGKCIQGDVHGPYDPSVNCKMWYQNDPFSKPLWYQNHPL